MGSLKYVNYLGVAGIAAGAFLVLTLASSGLEGKGRAFEEKTAGPFRIELTAVAGLLEADIEPIRPGAAARVYVRIADGRFDDAQLIRIGASPASGAPGKGALTEGPNGIAAATVRLPKDLSGATLWAEVEGWDGRVHRAEWPLRIE